MRARVQARAREAGLALAVLALLVTVMWALELGDAVSSGTLDDEGIRPREADGLPGIAFAPFLHGGFGHLVGNTIPLVVLGATVALGGLVRMLVVTGVVVVLGGLGVWLTASAGTNHIGASGLVFGYAAYLLARGFFTRSLAHLAVAALVVLVWGLTLVGGLVPTPGVSWTGHAFGALAGVLAARLLHGRRRAERPSAPAPQGVDGRSARLGA